MIPSGTARRLLSALLPEAARRTIDRARNRRTVATIAPANREFVARHGLQVSGGPFAGMQYLSGQEGHQGDLVLKLLGIYEQELAGAITSWHAAPPALIANVGCAEGYYAVGLARSMPSTRVLAYDIDPTSRAMCAELAALNDVADRIEILGECTPAALAALADEDVAVLSDCEGYELTLLDPAAVPALAGWRVVAECHDSVDSSVTATLERRFAPTHEVTVIPSVERASGPPEMAFMTPRQRALILNERPVAMNWVAMTPRARP